MIATRPWPDEATLIPDVLRSRPQSRAVLDRYGMAGCGGTDGPAETLGFFARAHDVPLNRLLEELQRVPAAPTLQVLGSSKPDIANTIYRPFFRSGIAVVLTLGAVWGAWLLIRVALAGEFSAAGVHEVNAHGHAQIFGWVGLFVMGFAYQAFPRFKHGTLAWPRLAMASLWLMLGGLVVRSVSQPLVDSFAWLWWPAIAASVAEVSAVLLFATIIVQTWRTSLKPLVFYDGYILAALGWFLVQAVYESIYLAATLTATGPDLISLVATWQGPLRDIQIHGFALLMILGVSQRIFHHFYALPEPNARLSLAGLALLNMAVVFEVAGSLLMKFAGRDWVALKYLGVVILAVVVTTLVANWRIFSKPEDADRSLKFLRAAYLWLLASLAMLVLLPVYQFGIVATLAPASDAARIGFSHAYYGATRHAITVGFVSLMIVGVASKVVPTLNGISSARLTALWGPFVLINLGCTLRVTSQIFTDHTGSAFPIAGVSGLLEVTGLALWGGHLWRIMSGRVRLQTAKTEMSAPAVVDRVLPGHTVAAVLDRHPQLLDVFLQFGFTTLADASMRQTIGRIVTIERACRRTGVAEHEFLAALNERIEGGPPEPARVHGECDCACGHGREGNDGESAQSIASHCVETG